MRERNNKKKHFSAFQQKKKSMNIVLGKIKIFEKKQVYNIEYIFKLLSSEKIILTFKKMFA